MDPIANVKSAFNVSYLIKTLVAVVLLLAVLNWLRKFPAVDRFMQYVIPFNG